LSSSSFVASSSSSSDVLSSSSSDEPSSSSVAPSSSSSKPSSSSSFITYNVIYDANGGTGTFPSQIKKHNVPLNLSGAVPTRTGYAFVTWNTAVNGNGTSYAPGANYTTNANVTLYAQWKANTYTVKYDANGVTGVTVPVDQTKTHNVALTLSNTTPAKPGVGYTFVNWNTAANGSGTPYAIGANYKDDASATLYAQWKCKTENGPSVKYGDETYESIVICGQIWFKRNLNYKVDSSMCYGDNNSNCAKYGRLYSWATAMALPSNCNTSPCVSQVSEKHNKGICPPGWHIPSAVEWRTLVSNVEHSQSCTNCAGKHLKATSGWKDCSASGSPSSSGMQSKSCLDSYGFSALPGGGEVGGPFTFSGNTSGVDGAWWSATERDGNSATLRYAHNSYEFLNEGLGGDGDRKLNMFSIRCLKD